MTSAGVASGKPIVSDDVIATILQNVGQLVQFNSTLLEQLETRMKNWLERGSWEEIMIIIIIIIITFRRSTNMKIGDIMARNAPFLKVCESRNLAL